MTHRPDAQATVKSRFGVLTGSPRALSFRAMATMFAAVALIVLASCGGAEGVSTEQVSAQKITPTSTTLPGENAGPADDQPLPELTEPAATSTDSPLGSDGLSLGADVAEIQSVMAAIHGPTDDLSNAMNRFTEFPADIATPLGSEIEDVSVRYVHTPNSGWIRLSAVRITTAATADEVIGFYEETMAAAGYVNPTRGEEMNGGVETRSLDYPVPDRPSLPGFAKVEILVTDSPDAVEVRINSNDQLLNLDQLDRLARWHGDAPLPANGDLLSISLSTSTFVDLTTDMTSVYRHSDVEPLDLLAQATALLPTADFALDETERSSPPADGQAYMVHDSLRQSNVQATPADLPDCVCSNLRIGAHLPPVELESES